MDPDDPIVRIQIDTKADVVRVLEENIEFYKTLSPAQLVSVFQDLVGRKADHLFNDFGRVIIDYPEGKDIRFEDYDFAPEFIVVEFIAFFKNLGHKNMDKYFEKGFVDFLRAYSIMIDKNADIKKLDEIGDAKRIFELFCEKAFIFIKNEDQAQNVIKFLGKYLHYLVENKDIDLNKDFDDQFMFCLFPEKRNWDMKLLIPSYKNMIDTLLRNGLSEPVRLFNLLFFCAKNNIFDYVLMLLDKGAPLEITDFNIFESVTSPEMVDVICDWIRKNPERVDQGQKEITIYNDGSNKVVKVDKLKVEDVINGYQNRKQPGNYGRPITLTYDKDIFLAFIRNGSLFEINNLQTMIEESNGKSYDFVIDYIESLFLEHNNTIPFQFDENSSDDMLRWRKNIISVSNQLDAKKPVVLPVVNTKTGELYGDLITRRLGRHPNDKDKKLLYFLGILGAVSARALPTKALAVGVNDRVRIEQYRLTKEQELGGKRIPGVENKDMRRLITLLSREEELCANLEEHFDFAELVALYMYVSHDKLTPERMENIYTNFAMDAKKAKSNLCSQIRDILKKKASNYSPPVSPIFTKTTGQELIDALFQRQDEKALEIINSNTVDLNEPVQTEYGKVLPLSIAFARGRRDDHTILNALLDNGARLDKKDGWGNTPILYAFLYSALIYGAFLNEYLEKNNPGMLKDPFYLSEKEHGIVGYFLKREQMDKLDDLKLILNTNPNIDTSRKIFSGSSIHDMFLRNFGPMLRYKRLVEEVERKNMEIRWKNEKLLRDADDERRRTGKYVEPLLLPYVIYEGPPNPEMTNPKTLDELENLLYDYENKQKTQ